MNTTPRRNSFYGFKVFMSGLLLGVVICAGVAGYWYFTRPQEAKAQETEISKWVGEHPKEVEWAKARYERFQQAATEAYFENDVEAIESSKE